jgi:hypothetical protein
MRTFGAGLTTLALGLATCLGASAQVESQKNRDEANQNQNTRGETKTIRGVIGAVTVEGETLVDQRTHRAVVAEATLVTVVGSKMGRRGARDGDNAARDRDENDRKDRDREASSNRGRHNVYVVLLTPKTQIRKAGARETGGDRDNPDAKRADDNANLEDDVLEVGDRVELTFVQKSSAGDNPDSINRKHGRHRTYFGVAVSINILSEPDQADRNRDSDRGSNANRDRDRDRDKNSGKENQNR